MPRLETGEEKTVRVTNYYLEVRILKLEVSIYYKGRYKIEYIAVAPMTTIYLKFRRASGDIIIVEGCS